MKYAVFLRGINIGPHKKVGMSDLKKALESLKYSSVKTLLNSGNVVLQTTDSPVEVTKKVQEKLKDLFGFVIDVVVVEGNELKELVDNDPFEKVKVNSNTRLYITFLNDKADPKFKTPYQSPDKELKILKVFKKVVISVVNLSTSKGTPKAMEFIEKEFGKKVTTRNWNTVIKVAKLLD